jgi:capsular polysaccharide biosynthesis protein
VTSVSGAVSSSDRRLPDDAQEASAIGARMAAQAAVLDGVPLDAVVEAMARASLPYLREAGVDVTIVRSRPNCLVVRSTASTDTTARSGCAIVTGWLRSLPRLAHQTSGTVVESTCATRGGDACLHALMWQAVEGAVGPPPAPPPLLAPPDAFEPVRLPSDAPYLPSTPVVAALTDPDPRAADQPRASTRSGWRRARRLSPRATSERRWSWFRRRGWMLVLGLVAGATGGQLAAAHHTPTYKATATLVVQSGASSNGPGSANDAETLAVTYAALLPSDQAVVAQAATDLGVTPATVSRSLSVQAEAGTALLKVQYSAPSAASAIAGADAVARTVSAAEPPSQAIASGSLAVVSRPRSASSSNPLYKDALLLGAILGLLLGAGAALVAERADRRVDDLESLSDAAGCLVTSLPGGISATEIARSLERVAGAEPVTVVPMRPAQSWAAEHLAQGLSTAWRHGEGAEQVVVSPAFAESTEVLGEGRGVTLLVVAGGERLRAVNEVVERLRLLGRDPAWSILVTGTAKPLVGSRAK